jgi:7-carboxy-7-deazaguanine synthase
MFGNNPIRSVERDPNNLRVQEIFYTIQGEGPFTGCPAIFIRLAGCNLACTFCDTEFESGYENVKSVQAIMDLVNDCSADTHRPPDLVVLTGGEPMRQDLSLLVPALVREGFRVQIETAGTLWQPDLLLHTAFGPVGGRLTFVCSPKTPRINPHLVQVCDHYKYILETGRVSHEDGLPLGGTQPGNLAIAQVLARPPTRSGVTVWVAPCDAHDERKNKENMALAVGVAMRYNYRLSLQTHKILGLP